MNISIITPLYYGSRYIEGLLDMVDSNTKNLQNLNADLKVEYIIVNDSPDQEIIIDNNKALSFDLKVITNAKNVGIHQSRVNGLNEAKGEYIVFLDQDDRINDNYLVSQYSKIGASDAIMANGYEKNKTLYHSMLALKLSCSMFFLVNSGCQIVSPGLFLIKKSSIPLEWKEHILRENGADDYFLWLLMMKNKAVFSFNNDKIFHHVITVDNTSGDLSIMNTSRSEMAEIIQTNHLLNQPDINKIKRVNKFLIKPESGIFNKFKKGLKDLDIAVPVFLAELFHIKFIK